MRILDWIKFAIRHYNDFRFVDNILESSILYNNRELLEENRYDSITIPKREDVYSKLENILKTSPYDFNSKIDKYKEIAISEGLLKTTNDYQLINSGVKAEDVIHFKSKNLLMILNHYIMFANPMYDIIAIELKEKEIVLKMDSLIFTAPFLKILESACLKMTDFTASVSVDMDYAINRLVFNVRLNSGKRGTYKAIKLFLACLNNALLDDLRFMNDDLEMRSLVKEYCSIFKIDIDFLKEKEYGHKDDILEILNNTIKFINSIDELLVTI